VSIHISNRNRNALAKAGPLGSLFGEITGSIAELSDWVLNLVFGKASKIWV
jgi:hypothetical protein